MQLATMGVPERFRLDLAKLSALDSSVIANLVSALKSDGSKGNIVATFASVAGLEKSDTMVEALRSLSNQQLLRRMTAADVASAVSGSPHLEITERNRERLQQALQELLSLEVFTSTAKANELMTDHQNVFHQARVITDFRPVFGEHVTTPPVGMLLVGTLKVEYFADTDIRSMYFAMDEHDLRQLRDMADRGLAKFQSLKSLSQSSGVPVFDPEDGIDD